MTLPALTADNINGNINLYNSMNAAVAYSLASYVALAIFATISYSTPLTLAGGAALMFAMRSEEKMLAAPIMLSAATRLVFGATPTLILATIALGSMAIRRQRVTKLGAASIAGTLVTSLSVASAAGLVGLSGAALLGTLYLRAGRKQMIHALQVLKEADTAPDNMNIRGGEQRYLINMVPRFIVEKLPSLSGSLLNSYDDNVEVEITNRGQHGLNEAAIRALVDRANAENESVDVQLANSSFKKAVLASGALLATLAGAATVPAVAYAAFTAGALYYRYYDLASGFALTTAVQIFATPNPLMLLVPATLAIASTNRGRALLPTIMTSIASVLLFQLSVGLLFAGLVASVPYTAIRLAQKEDLMKYTNAAKMMIQQGDTRLKIENGRFRLVPPLKRQGGPMDRLLRADTFAARISQAVRAVNNIRFFQTAQAA